jgi:hypothetical protein
MCSSLRLLTVHLQQFCQMDLWLHGAILIGVVTLLRCKKKLKNIRQLAATHAAFAAILDGGSVVAWGNTQYGGDSIAVQDRFPYL